MTSEDINSFNLDNPAYNFSIKNTLNVFGFNTSWFMVQNQTDQTGNNYYVLDMNNLQEYLENYKNGYVNFVLGSSIHFIVDRVNAKNCSANPEISKIINSNQMCYSVLYDSSTAETQYGSTFASLISDTIEFETADQAGIHLDVINNFYP